MSQASIIVWESAGGVFDLEAAWGILEWNT
jgi:hypothetical protein